MATLRLRRAMAGFVVVLCLVLGVGSWSAAAAPVHRDARTASLRAVTTAVHGRTVVLRWRAPEVPTTGYEVRYRVGSTGDWSTRISTRSTHLRITRLIGGERTWFVVRARTARGRTAWTHPRSAMPVSAPGPVGALDSVSPSGKARLTWSAPGRSGGRAVARYELQYRTTGEGRWITATRSATTATLTGLIDDTRYSIRVRAVNAVGAGPWSTVLRVVAGSDDGSLPAAAISEVRLSTDESTVQVVLPRVSEEPAAVVPMTAVPVEVAEPSPSSDPSAASAPAAPATVDPEPPAAAVAPVTVPTAGTDSIVASPIASPASMQVPDVPVVVPSSPGDPVVPAATPTAIPTPTVAAPPGVPGAVHAETGDGSISLSWGAPVDGGPVAGYQVRWRVADGEWQVVSGATAPSVALVGLTNGVDHEFGVRAVGSTPGQWTATTAARPGTPEAPAAPSVAFSGGDLGVQVGWSGDGAATYGADVVGWDLRYQAGGDAAWTTTAVDGSGTTLDALPGGFAYRFVVRMRTSYGTSEWSPPTTRYVPVLTLPVTTIETTGRSAITSTDTYLDGSYTVDPNGTSAPASSGSLQIKGRGNSTWGAPKKPYRLKLTAATAVLGMPANKNWVLLANYYDHSLLRNDTALYLGTKTSLAWTPRSQYTEVVLNGDYVGLYQMAEQVRIDPQRINIKAMKAGDNSGTALTGGYQLERDGRYDSSTEAGFVTSMNQPIVIQDPEVPTDQQRTYIINYVNAFEAALRSDQRGDPLTGYAKYIDVQSFADWYIVEEYVQNVDANFASVDLYKPRSGLLTMGPLWDFDLALENDGRLYGKRHEWYVRDGAWWSELFKDPAWQTEIESRWHVIRASLDDLEQHVDATDQLIATAADDDSMRWDTHGDHEIQVQIVKEFLEDRAQWLDQQWGTGT